jgi:uncharacterized protein
MKFLVVIVVVGVVLWLLLGRGRSLPRRPGTRAAGPPNEEMVRCAHCGLHLPRSEAVSAGGQLYCSDAHRIAGAGPADRP